MRPEEFVDTVVPSGIRYAAWTGGTYRSGLPKFKHKPFTKTAALCDFILEKDAEFAGSSENVYFALAAFVSARVEKTLDNGDKYMACSRRQSNVRALRSFWIDMDCKQDSYASHADALSVLVQHVKAGDLPSPTFVVSSGHGLHVYWCMDEDMPPEVWQPLANGFRDRFIQLGVRIDPGVTTDSARILRLPGTHNRKDAAAPLPVSLLKAGPVWSRPNLLPYLSPPGATTTAARTSSAPLPGVASKAFGNDGAAVNASLSAGIATRRNIKSLTPVVEQCAQLRAMNDTGGAGCSEPLWMAALHLAAYADDGAMWAHALSSGHADYLPAETDAKFAARIAAKDRAGPTLCATFAKHRPEGCVGCPHNGLIRSPIALKDVDVCLPSGFECDSQGLFKTLFDEYGAPHGRVKISDALIYAGQVFFREQVGYVLRARMRRLRSDRRDVDVDIEARHLVAGSSKAFSYLETVVGLQPGAESHMVNFARSWTEELRRRRGAATSYRTLGWAPDMRAFVFGDDVVTEDGLDSGFVIDVDRSFGDSFTEVGSVDVWKEAAAYIARASARCPELSVLLAVSFGAPLMAMTPEQGLVMTFQSATSGVGKTKAMTTAAAVWGDPELVMFKHNDTPLSVERRLGVAKSFPGLWDEVRPSRKEADAFRSLIYHISGGRERSRLKSDASAQTVGRWKTLMAMATNYDLLELVADSDDNASPAAARLLPFTIRTSPGHDPAADTAFARLGSNFGGAGKEFMAYVISNRPKIEAALAAVAEALRKSAHGAETESRFIVSGCAATLVGAAAARSAGLVDFDLPAMRQCIEAAIERATRRQTREKAIAVSDATGRLGALMAIMPETRELWIVTDSAGRLIRRPVFAAREPLWHIDLLAGTATIRSRALHVEMARRKISQSVLVDMLENGSVVQKSASFGAGTPYAYPSEPCYVFDLMTTGAIAVVDSTLNS